MNPTSRLVLLASLCALAVLYAVWFAPQSDAVAALLVFVLPAALLAVPVLRRARRAHFWAGVASLAWFTHAVTVLYERPAERGWATAELLLALVILFAASLPGLRARREARRAAKTANV